LLNALLKGVSQEQVERLTDGPGGWNVVETLCHIRDFAEVSLTRAQLILTSDQPLLPDMDPLESSTRRDYAHQNLKVEFVAYLDSRKTLMILLNSVSGEQWQREGIHAKYGKLTLLELLVFIEWHDVNHLEQIARILKLSEALL
jgi:hypothetical protein